MQENLHLNNGSKIAVIGGGPAGSLFAHFALKWAQKKGTDITVTIFDGKDFLLRGPKGCNLCAGVIAESLNQKLKDEGIFLPEKRIVNRVDGYTLHVRKEKLFLSCSENEINSITTVFRGNGPRYSTFPDIISFDDFLLSWAQDSGVKVITQPVQDIQLSKEKNQPAVVYYGTEKKLQKFEANLVVGAFGVNSYMIHKIQNLGFGYKPPATLLTYQAEMKLGRENIRNLFGNTIHVFMPKSKSLRYATVIPKGDYITISIIGKKHATKDMYDEFLHLEELQNRIPLLKPHCFCYPKIVVSPSKRPFHDRLVMIGDASFSRHYKNGIESAFITAQLAAETAFQKGIDASSFSVYYQKAKKLIIHDNFFGRLLFFINDVISSIPVLTQSHLSLARKTDQDGPSKKLKRILWNMFTGNIPYKNIFRSTLNLRLQTSLTFNTTRILFQKIKNAFKLKRRIRNV